MYFKPSTWTLPDVLATGGAEPRSRAARSAGPEERDPGPCPWTSSWKGSRTGRPGPRIPSRPSGAPLHGPEDSVEASVSLGAVEDFGDADVLLEDEVEYPVVANAQAVEGRIALRRSRAFAPPGRRFMK